MEDSKQTTEQDIRTYAGYLLDSLWGKVYSGSRSVEENWAEMDKKFPLARNLHNALKVGEE